MLTREVAWAHQVLRAAPDTEALPPNPSNCEFSIALHTSVVHPQIYLPLSMEPAELGCRRNPYACKAYKSNVEARFQEPILTLD